MQTSNGQSSGMNDSSSNTTSDTRNVSKVQIWLTPSQAEFIDMVVFHGVQELARSLRMIHDIALYHSDIPFDEPEKIALFEVKLLWEGLEQIG